MPLADLMELEHVPGTAAFRYSDQPALSATTLAQRIPSISLEGRLVEFEFATAESSTSGSVTVTIREADEATFPLPRFTTVGHVRLRISALSTLQPPTAGDS